ncbi:hypothetical protein SBOR_5894 [Sclerotinia borealis F-4128]|uniref:Methyltransferase domain-containing protein n=1 Tax=Sclerotinia borealis (strain F-4128) TaxID=1432307 RepID=W9CG20_SCLBF|nr:hypothetical protein SBOR_5894 [Sclerotinia borealis F-4128]
MAEAAFFYNTTVQKPDRSKPPSAHTNIPIHSQAQPVRPFTKKSSRSRSQSTSSSQRNELLPLPLDPDYPTPVPAVPPPPFNLQQVPSSPSTLDTLVGTTTSKSDKSDSNNQEVSDRTTSSSVGTGIIIMLSTPLVDYKHSANQTNKARTATEAKAKRKSSSTSGHSSHSNKNASGVERYASTNSAAHQQRGVSESAGRANSISSTAGSSQISKINSKDRDPLGSSIEDLMAQPFTKRNGRRYLRDPSLAYPLPCDLPEIHRQTLRTMLLCQVFNGPTCSPAFNNRPPKRVLEVACGTGFWSVMCHKHFSHKGHSSISFTGIDIAPLAPRMDADDDMNWRFVQHDLRKTPLPFRDEEFSLIMVKDASMILSTKDNFQALMDEYLRILKPGGTLEFWDGDHTIRMLLSHTPPATKDKDNSRQAHKQIHTNAMGAYTITPQTPLAAPRNQFLIDYNTWISKALESKDLPPMPCTNIRPLLLQEAEVLEQIESRRLAIPLGEVRWEREGVGGSATLMNGLHGSNGKVKEVDRKHLTPGQAALRRTALMSIIQMIESLEPLLKEASGKTMDEWDRWCGHLMTDMLKNNGTSWGECLEVGAWWAKKKDPKSDSNT